MTLSSGAPAFARSPSSRPRSTFALHWRKAQLDSVWALSCALATASGRNSRPRKFRDASFDADSTHQPPSAQPTSTVKGCVRSSKIVRAQSSAKFRRPRRGGGERVAVVAQALDALALRRVGGGWRRVGGSRPRPETRRWLSMPAGSCSARDCSGVLPWPAGGRRRAWRQRQAIALIVASIFSTSEPALRHGRCSERQSAELASVSTHTRIDATTLLLRAGTGPSSRHNGERACCVSGTRSAPPSSRAQRAPPPRRARESSKVALGYVPHINQSTPDPHRTSASPPRPNGL